MESLDENTVLDDKTQLILDVDGEVGTFKTRSITPIVYNVFDEESDIVDKYNIVEFVCLNSVWYGHLKDKESGNSILRIVH